MLRFEPGKDWFGRQKSLQWSTFAVGNFGGDLRTHPIMAALSPNTVMIYGGYEKSDGILVDTEKRKVVRSFDTGDIQLYSDGNSYCITEYDALVASVMSNNSFELIEVSLIDFSARVLEDLD